MITHIYRAFHAPRIICRIKYGQACVDGEDRRSLAETLHQSVSEYFEPMEQMARDALERIDVLRKVARPLVYGDGSGATQNL